MLFQVNDVYFKPVNINFGFIVIRFEFAKSEEISFIKQHEVMVSEYLNTVSLKVFIFSDKSDVKHLFTALSVQGKTKASLLAFHLYIFYAETSFLKIINEESTQLYRAILSLGSYRVQRWSWNMNSYEWVIWISKASQSRKLFEGSWSGFFADYNSIHFVCVF